MIKLVIADDEYFIRARLSKIISEKRQNIDITSLCEDGEDVLKCISLTDIDILLMDIKMISLSGLEVAKYIFENNIKTKIILLSGYNDFNFAVEAMRYCVFDYLTKPISEDELLHSLDKCISTLATSKRKYSVKYQGYKYHKTSCNKVYVQFRQRSLYFIYKR